VSCGKRLVRPLEGLHGSRCHEIGGREVALCFRHLVGADTSVVDPGEHVDDDDADPCHEHRRHQSPNEQPTPPRTTAPRPHGNGLVKRTLAVREIRTVLRHVVGQSWRTNASTSSLSSATARR